MAGRVVSHHYRMYRCTIVLSIVIRSIVAVMVGDMTHCRVDVVDVPEMLVGEEELVLPAMEEVVDIKQHVLKQPFVEVVVELLMDVVFDLVLVVVEVTLTIMLMLMVDVEEELSSSILVRLMYRVLTSPELVHRTFVMMVPEEVVVADVLSYSPIRC